MIRIAKPTDPLKMAELKNKIHTTRYLQSAVSGIASILARGLLEWNGVELDNEQINKKK